MLIAQIFPVVSVYNLPGGQYAYRGNIINFPQDVQEFVTRLPRDPSSLDLLVVRRYTENGSNFRDFQVHREKVMRALLWLKANNIYYRDIDIDNNILQKLPENGSIAEQLPQVSSNKAHHEEEGPNEQHEDGIEDDEARFTSQTFVPMLHTGHSENNTINEVLHRMQHDRPVHENWPHNEDTPVDEFHTLRYMVRAFPTLYP